jgi:hypothetical protein
MPAAPAPAPADNDVNDAGASGIDLGETVSIWFDGSTPATLLGATAMVVVVSNVARTVFRLNSLYTPLGTSLLVATIALFAKPEAPDALD